MSRLAVVTGSTGFLGKRFIKTLAAEDVQIRCLVRETSDVDAMLAEIPKAHQPKIQIVRGDLNDTAFLEQNFQNSDIVYHLAAALGGSTSTLFLNTVIPTRQLIDVASRCQVGRFVLISSMGVYGTEQVRRWGTITEETAVDPNPELRDPYTFSKVRQEWVAREAYEKQGLPLVVIRPGVIYGPGRNILTSRVGLSLGPLLIRMGGRHQLPYTYVDNCADAIKQAGLVPNIEGQVFNVIDDNLPTGGKLIQAVKRSGKKVRSVWVPGITIAPLSSIYHWYARWSEGQLPEVITRYKSNAIWKPLKYSNAKAKHSLKWQPIISTEDAIQRTIAG